MRVPLTPLRFLYRARDQFGAKVGIIDGGRSWTYRDFSRRCHRLAAILSSRRLPAGSRVALLSYNQHPLLEAYYGVPLAGCILLPLNTRLRAGDFRHILNDAEARVLIFHPDFLPIVEEIRQDLHSVRRFLVLEPGPSRDWIEPVSYEHLMETGESAADRDIAEVDEEEVAELFYTSGTTALPKGVMLTHRNLYLHALEVSLALGIREEDTQLHTIPLFHVNGWGTPQFLTCLGGRHVLMKRFHPGEAFRLIQEHGVTFFFLVPTMAISLLNHSERDRFDTSSVRLINLGGAAANPRLVEQLEKAFDCRCVAGYGLTECSPVVTLSFPKSHLAVQGERRLALQSMTGYPIPGVELALLDQQGRSLPWNGSDLGEIAIRGDGVMKGYWGQTETEPTAGNWLRTGDLATIDPDGYVQIVDRKKDIIVSGGENISSLEVERVLLSHPGVLECAVIPAPDEHWGEIPKAVVVPRTPGRVTGKELVSYCRRRLAPFKVPRIVELVSDLPKGGTGKILKRELRKRG